MGCQQNDNFWIMTFECNVNMLISEVLKYKCFIPDTNSAKSVTNCVCIFKSGSF